MTLRRPTTEGLHADAVQASKRKGNNAEHYRYGAAHLPLADDLTRTLRSFRNDPWFVPMVASWRLVIDGELEKADEARALAASVGEAAYFDAEMAPAMRSGDALRERQLMGGASLEISAPRILSE